MIREDLLHFIWRTKRFDVKQLVTTNGDKIELLDWGQLNHDAGPDFLNSKIKIGNTIWAGQIEMHLKSSDWNNHKHSTDAAYNNVILHVVFEHDIEIETKNGYTLPCLELKSRIDSSILQNYRELMSSTARIPCEQLFHHVRDLHRDMWLERVLVERLEYKTQFILTLLVNTKNDWDEVIYVMVARYLGMKVNTEPMQMLAERVPLKILEKHSNQEHQVAALLFGASGLLDEADNDEYVQLLQREWNILKVKYSIEKLPSTIWKRLRLRPANFPSIRIAQLAALVCRAPRLMRAIRESNSIQDCRSLFLIEPSKYWKTHYSLGEVSAPRTKKLGKQAVDSILINVVSPMLFQYGKQRDQAALCDRGVDLLRELPAENNTITRIFSELDFNVLNAHSSQSVLQLHKAYCLPKKCTQCGVGQRLIQGLR